MKKLYTLLSVIVVAFLFGGVAVTSAYAAPASTDADVSAPELVSASLVADEVEPGEEVSVKWSARDAGGIEYVSFGFKAPTGRTFYLSTYAYGTTATGLQNGFASQIVDGGSWPSGTYTLAYVTLSDKAGNSSTKSAYDPGFQALTFNVIGTDADVSAPELVSASLVAAEVEPGEEVSVKWSARDAGGIEYVSFGFKAPTGRTFYLSTYAYGTTATGLQNGFASQIVDGGSWPSGTYTLAYVTLSDKAGNSSTKSAYDPGFQALTFNVKREGATPPASEPTVSPSTQPSTPPMPTETPPLEPSETAEPTPDTTAPEFHSLQVTAATFRDPNFGIMWTAIDESPLTSVTFELRMPDGSSRWVLHTLDPLTQLPGLQLGTYIADLSDGTWPNGDYEILTVRLTDSANYVSEHTAATWNPDIAPQIFTVDLPLATPLPTIEPTAEPTAEPTPAPTAEPTAEPTPAPTAEPTAEPTPAPTAEPTAEPTPAPTAEPTAEPTPAPTAEPTAEPTPAPTAEPTAEPTPAPTAEPTAEPTPAPTAEPTAEPTPAPTAEPTAEPTPAPTAEPTAEPTASEVATQTKPSNASPPAGALATTGAEGNIATWLGLGSLVLVAGISLLLRRREPTEH
ncbi:PT domain-containing protein [Pseudoclavibacter sp. JSM 162008]|uniref:Ig-like domain repeat protein n=1 Tax=Pseudoclavibacter sp. JSM 162008 TaxID=3229855 RepID=UPI0035262B57